MESITLISIGRSGELSEPVVMSDLGRSVVSSTVGMYHRTGYAPPWVGYLAILDHHVVGSCAFKSPPIGGRVEVAYFTFPELEGRGIATEMARQLLQIARNHDADLIVTAQTLPEENASTTILRKLGFHLARSIDHPDDGLVWEWELSHNRRVTEDSVHDRFGWP